MSCLATNGILELKVSLSVNLQLTKQPETFRCKGLIVPDEVRYTTILKERDSKTIHVAQQKQQNY